MRAPLPEHEHRRLKALEQYAVLDTPAEESYDRIARLTASLLQRPLALINLIDRDRQWSKATSSGERGELPRDLAFCPWAILSDDLLVIEDTARDPRLAGNPFTAAYRFYAAAPLIVRGGHRLGTVCVVDRQPSSLSEEQRDILRTMAGLVTDQLELRPASRRLAEELERRLTAERTRDEVEARLETSVESLPVPLWMTDHDGRYMLLNRVARERWGDLTGQRPEDIAQPEAVRDLWAACNARALAGETIRHEVTYEGAQGLEVVEEFIGPVRHDGRLIGLIGIGIDQTDRRRAEAEVRELAVIDVVSGLPNRRALLERLETIVGAGHDAPVALIRIDLDHFKDVNDEIGHEAGDEVLRRMGGRLREWVGESGYVARHGGDELAVVLSRVGDAERARVTAGQLLAEIARPMLSGDRELRLSASAGIALHPDHGGTVEVLLKHAGMALYAAKGSGRGRAKLFTTTMRVAAQRRQRLADAMRRDLLTERFELRFQPVVAMRDREHHGFEALIRWRRDREPLGPAAFLRIAEETGLIVPLGRMILRRALEQLREWSDDGLGPGVMAVNVAAAQLQFPGFAAEVTALLGELRLDPRQVKLEITENVLLTRDAVRILASLKGLHAAGVGVALDDFGTGYASLTHLRRFPVSQIKIDRSFVANLTDHAADAAIVESLVNLARALRISVVAEGVETEAQRRQLTRWGCDYGQGHLFAAPLTGDDARSYLVDADRSVLAAV